MTDDTNKRPPLPDWAIDMAAKVDFDPNAERAAANFAHNPCGMTPANYDVPQVRANPPRPERGERPLVNPDNPQHPTPGVTLLDRQLIAEAQRERQRAEQPDVVEKMTAAMTAMMQMQSQTLAILAQLTNKAEKK